MKLIENLNGAKGILNIVLRDETGTVKQEVTVPNLVVDAGLDYIASRMKDTSKTAMSHMAIGDGDQAGGATNPAAGDTALQHQLARVSLTSTTVTDNAVAYVATFGAGTGTGAVTEAGIFNNSTGGDMLCRTEFAVINKGASDSMTITWTVTIS
jgi:hypothetical protein